MSAPRQLLDRIDRFFFTPSSGFDLAVCRALLFGALFVQVLRRDFAAFAQVAPEAWNPVGPFALGLFPRLTHGQIVAVEVVYKIALALSAIGLFARFAMPAAFLCATWLLAWTHSWQKIHLTEQLLVFVLAVLALSRAGDVGSLDALRRRRPMPPSGEMTWPIRTVWIALCLVFFGAGVAKLRTCGLGWISGSAMSNLMMMHAYDVGLNHGVLAPLTALLAPHLWLCWLMAFGTVVFEVAFPLALLSARARAVLFPTAIVFMLLNATMLVPSMVAVLSCTVFFVPWERGFAAAQRLIQRRRAGVGRADGVP